MVMVVPSTLFFFFFFVFPPPLRYGVLCAPQAHDKKPGPPMVCWTEQCSRRIFLDSFVAIHQ